MYLVNTKLCISISTATIAAVISVICQPAAAQAIPQPWQSKETPELFMPGKRTFPAASRGYLLSHKRTMALPESAAVYMISETTAQSFSVPLSIEGATALRIEQAVVTIEGTVLIAGTMTRSEKGQTVMRNLFGPDSLRTTQNVIAEVSSTGKLIHVTDLGGFTAERMCSAGDGTTWLLGQEWAEEFKGKNGLSYSLLRHVRADGSTINSYLGKNVVTKGIPLNYRARTPESFTAFIACDASSVAAYVQRPLRGFILEQVDSKSNTETTQVVYNSPGLELTGFAMTFGGHLYASFQPSKSANNSTINSLPGLYSIVGGTWLYMPPETSQQLPIGRILGSSGSSLVHLLGNEDPQNVPVVYWTRP